MGNRYGFRGEYNTHITLGDVDPGLAKAYLERVLGEGVVIIVGQGVHVPTSALGEGDPVARLDALLDEAVARDSAA